MPQPTLFDLDPTAPLTRRGRLDADSEAFLDRYLAHYERVRSRGAVRGEASQLRTIVRESASLGPGGSLLDVLADTPTLAAVLTSPARQPSATTALIRLGAINSALLLRYGAEQGPRRIVDLDAALPRRDGAEWYQSGVILAGRRERRRAQSPTIEPSDLPRIVEAAGAGKLGPRSLRDRLLVAVHCYSGLSVGEICALRWSELRWESDAEVWSTPIEREGKAIRVAIFGPAASLMARLRLEGKVTDEHVVASARGKPLTERQVRRIVLAACAAAGFPHAERSTLLSASAAHLSVAGLTDHEVAIALGVADMRTINRRLRPHQRLAAQRIVGGQAYSS